MLRAGSLSRLPSICLRLPNVVEVPISALVEDGKDSIVFVQPDPERADLHHAPRGSDEPFRPYGLRAQHACHDKDDERAADTEPLKAGERVITAGALELKTALENKLSEAASKT